MKGQRGFSLIELLIVVVIIGIIAAIAIPNMIAARRAGNEGSAISALRTIYGAQSTYAATKGDGEYAGTPSALDGVALTQLAADNLIDPSLGSGFKAGYNFTSGTTVKTATQPATFCTRALPITPAGIAATGSRCFAIATDGIIQANSASDVNNCGCVTTAGGVAVSQATPIQ